MGIIIVYIYFLLYESNITIFHPGELFAWIDRYRINANRRKVIEAVVCTTLWMVWRYRNDVVHDAGKMKNDMLVDSIKEFSFLWFSNRFQKDSVRWNLWLFSPLNVV